MRSCLQSNSGEVSEHGREFICHLRLLDFSLQNGPAPQMQPQEHANINFNEKYACAVADDPRQQTCPSRHGRHHSQ
jgi:hypothetical protein